MKPPFKSCKVRIDGAKIVIRFKPKSTNKRVMKDRGIWVTQALELKESEGNES